MKLKNYMAIMLLAATTTGLLSSCSDDDNLGDAPRLFRPVASLVTSNNTITASWDNIAGATQYNLTLYRVTGTDEAGENTYETVKTATCESSPYTFDDLAWDEKYKVDIACAGANVSSKTYTTNDVNVSYPTTLKSVKTIDNAARVTWDNGKKEEASPEPSEDETACTGGCTCEGCGQGENCTCTNCQCPNCKPTEEETTPAEPEEGTTPEVTVIKAIVAIPVDGGGERVVKTINSATFEQGQTDIIGLSPQTKYYFVAYTTNDENEFNNSTYAGRLSGTTSTPKDFDTEYGAGMWLDIRGYDEKQAKDTLKTDEFWAQVSDGMTIILRGDFDYKVNNSHPIDKSVRFVTASTLGSNARFVSSGGLTLAKNVTVDFLEFVNVDFISDKALPGGGNEIATNTDKGFGGRQVFNINGTGSTLKKLSFKGSKIEGYRAVVRAQAATDGIQEIVVDKCIINGIGDQGVFTTNNKAADFQKVTLKNSTITNIVMLCDFRGSKGNLDLNIQNCTFCYAPIETTANANTPLMRINGNSNTVTINVENTLFGPSMYTGGGGSAITTYKAGEKGSIFLNPSETTLASVAKSFKTNFGWTEVGANLTTYPLDGLQELNFDENALWSAPSKGEFKVIGNIGEDGIGDPRWNE